MNLADFFPKLPALPDALCADYYNPDIFFPQSREQERKTLPFVQSICNECPEKARCLEYALTEQIEDGIWAGTTPAMRRRMYRRVSTRGINTTAQKIRVLNHQGRKPKEIAKALNVEHSYVTTILKREQAKLEGAVQSQRKTEQPQGELQSSSESAS